MYRGFDIADLAEHATYEETAYLLLNGELPSSDELDTFREQLAERELPDPVVGLIDRCSGAAEPMDMVRTAVSMLSFTDPDRGKIDAASGHATAARLIAQ